jgi:uncharacterized SAM-binding protein YcdF (DUF218 family)
MRLAAPTLEGGGVPPGWRDAFQFLRVWGIRSLAVIGFLTILFVATPAALWLMPSPAGSFAPPAGDTLIVLGAGVVADFPDLETYWRCVYAVRFFRTGSFQRIIVAGGSPGAGDKPVAAVMAAYIESAHIPADKILLETSSHSTRENALFVRDMLRGISAGRLVLLTSDYHTRRAEAAFRRVGLNPAVVAIPYVIKLADTAAYRPMLLETVLLEQVKRLWYRYQGWT